MNKKAIGITVALAGAGLIGLYFYLRKKPQVLPAASGVGSTSSTSTSSGGSIISNVSKTINNLLHKPAPTSSTSTPSAPAFNTGDFVYAKIDTNIYSYPNFSTTDLVGSVKKGDKIGTYAGSATSMMSMIFIGGDTRYVKTADIYTQ